MNVELIRGAIRSAVFARSFPGNDRFEVEVVDREIPLLGVVAGDVHYVQQYEGAMDDTRRVSVGHLLEDLHPVELVSVGRGCHEAPRAVVFPVGDRHRDVDGIARIGLAQLLPELEFLARSNVDIERKRTVLLDPK